MMFAKVGHAQRAFTKEGGVQRTFAEEGSGRMTFAEAAPKARCKRGPCPNEVC